jgi:hypothetical protein
MSSIKPPSGWNLALDEYQNKGEITLEKRDEGVKIHCNDKGDSYMFTAIHMIDGLLTEKKIGYDSDIEFELKEFAEHIDSNHL